VPAPTLTKAQVIAEVRGLLARVLGRLVRAEATGTLTPAEARVMAGIRAREAREAVGGAAVPERAGQR
jgi:hypothetical protein